MNLAVVGLGLVSPLGMSPAEHVFFPRARLPAPPPRLFLDAEDRRLSIVYCPVLGARAPVAERLAWLASRAAVSAAAPLREAHLEDPLLVACGPAPRPGLAASDVAEAERAVAAELGGSVQLRAPGEAGVFSTLEAVERLLAEGSRRGGPAAAVIFAADSFISLPALAAEQASPPSPWALPSPPASEGGGAIALMLPAGARAAALPVLGTLTGAALAQGAARDDNDEVVDGAAMTAALRALPASSRAAMAFGQEAVDALRLREWRMAAARQADRFDPGCVFACLEAHAGRVGAAAGVMSLAYGHAVYRHGAGAGTQPQAGSFYAWAISRDGTRGIASCRAGAS